MKLGTAKGNFETRPLVALDRHEGYRQAVTKLEELKKALATHKGEVSRLELALVRASSAARQASERGFRVLRDLDESGWNTILRRIVTAGLVTKDLLTEVRLEIPRPQVVDQYDAALLSSLSDARAAIELLERAIAFQDKELRTQKRMAVQQICVSLQKDRAPIITVLAEALIQLSSALAQEKVFREWLQKADPELVAAMRPRLLPSDLLANAGLFEWLIEIREENMLSAEQIEALNLIPARAEAVS